MRLDMRLVINAYASEIWPFAFAFLLIILSILWQKKRDFPYVLCAAIFGIYSIFALDKVFFPLHLSGSFVDTMREQPLFSLVNPIPFYFGKFSSFNDALETNFLNIILTIPFGFGINFLLSTKPKHIMWIAFWLGLTLEALQFLFTLILGYPYRVVDINDCLTNALGVLLGYGFFRIFACLYLWLMQRFTTEQTGIFAYIHGVASRASQ